MTILANTKIRNTMIALGLDVATGDLTMFIVGAIITGVATFVTVNIIAQD